MSALRRELGHGQVGTQDVLLGCGHMHGQHATTESTQIHNILYFNGSFIGQGGKAGGRPCGGLILGCWCHEMRVNLAI
jgi:hypothetical protein